MKLSQNHPDCPKFSCWWHWVYHGLPRLGRTPLYLWAIAHSIALSMRTMGSRHFRHLIKGRDCWAILSSLGAYGESTHVCLHNFYTYPWLHTNSIPLNVFCFTPSQLGIFGRAINVIVLIPTAGNGLTHHRHPKSWRFPLGWDPPNQNSRMRRRFFCISRAIQQGKQWQSDGIQGAPLTHPYQNIAAPNARNATTLDGPSAVKAMPCITCLHGGMHVIFWTVTKHWVQNHMGRWCCSELNHYLRASGVWANPNPLSICKISMCWWKIHDQPSKNWWFNPYFGVSPTGSTRINERPLHSRKTPPRMTSRAAIKSRGATLSARLKGSVVVIKGSNPTV